MEGYHYHHLALYLVASIPIWLMVWLLYRVEPEGVEMGPSHTVYWTHGRGYVWRLSQD